MVESSESTFQIISVYKVFLTPLGVPSPVRGGGGPREEKQFIAGGAERELEPTWAKRSWETGFQKEPERTFWEPR